MIQCLYCYQAFHQQGLRLPAFVSIWTTRNIEPAWMACISSPLNRKNQAVLYRVSSAGRVLQCLMESQCVHPGFFASRKCCSVNSDWPPLFQLRTQVSSPSSTMFHCTPWAWLDWQVGRYHGRQHPGTQQSPAQGSVAWDLPPHLKRNLAGCKQVPGLLAWDLPDVLNRQGVMKKCVCMSVRQCVTAERTLFSHVLLCSTDSLPTACCT